MPYNAQTPLRRSADVDLSKIEVSKFDLSIMRRGLIVGGVD